MLRAIHVHQYEGGLDTAIERAFVEYGITRDNLVSVEYSARVMDIPVCIDGEQIQGNQWFASALIVYEEASRCTSIS